MSDPLAAGAHSSSYHSDTLHGEDLYVVAEAIGRKLFNEDLSQGSGIDNDARTEATFGCCVGRIGADRKGYAHLR